MGKDDPYQMNKLVCDSTTSMSEKDIKKARKQLGRPDPRADSFDLDKYLAQQTRGQASEVVVHKGMVARIEPSTVVVGLDEDAPFIVWEEDAVTASDAAKVLAEKRAQREAAVLKYTAPRTLEECADFDDERVFNRIESQAEASIAPPDKHCFRPASKQQTEARRENGITFKSKRKAKVIFDGDSSNEVDVGTLGEGDATQASPDCTAAGNRKKVQKKKSSARNVNLLSFTDEDLVD